MWSLTAVPHSSYEMHFASPTFSGRDRDPRPTVLPPIQSSGFTCTSDELASPDAVCTLPPCDGDDSVPPVVRFKNRYRRAQVLEEQQRQHYYETSRDCNDNEMSKTNWSPVEDEYPADDVYCHTSPPKILSDQSAVGYNVEEKWSISEESPRTCEKRTWSRITPEVDLSEQWMSSSKIPCRENTVDSRRSVADRQTEQCETDELLNQYQQIRRRNLEYHNGIDRCAEPKCEPLSIIVIVFIFYCNVNFIFDKFFGNCRKKK